MKTFVGTNAGDILLKKLFNSSKSVLICSPWISFEYAEKINDLVEKGIDVKIILSGDEHDDYKKTLKLFKEKKNKSNNKFNYKIAINKFVHAKIYVIDDEYGLTGSVNLTRNGLWDNVEHLVTCDEPDEVAQMKKDFFSIWELYEKYENDENKALNSSTWKKLKNKF